jgi:hypothetical protein
MGRPETVANVHLTGSAAKDGTGGQSQLSYMASVISNEDITYELAQQQRQLAKQQEQRVEQQLVTNRVIEAISSGKDRTQTADALGLTVRQLTYHFQLGTKAGRAGCSYHWKKRCPHASCFAHASQLRFPLGWLAA